MNLLGTILHRVGSDTSFLLFLNLCAPYTSSFPFVHLTLDCKGSEFIWQWGRATKVIPSCPFWVYSFVFFTYIGAGAPSAWRQDFKTFNSVPPSSRWPFPLKSLDHFSSFLSSTWFSSLVKGFSSLSSFGATKKSSLPRVSINPPQTLLPHWNWVCQHISSSYFLGWGFTSLSSYKEPGSTSIYKRP